MDKNIKIYGFGVVAQGFYNYLKTNNQENRLHTIVIKDTKKRRKKISATIQVTNNKTVHDKDMDVLIELINSSDEAYEIVTENLEIGKKVISANKKLIAENLTELVQLEKNNNATFLYEGAVCGSIPIIRILNDFYTHEPIKSIAGIFNGSSNYILSQLFSKNIPYEEALKQAQGLGFAESDPTSDVGGFDALYKLIIITAHAFGQIFKPQEVLNIGIENISATDIQFAKKNNLKIKLVAKVIATENTLSLSVLPTLIDSHNELYQIENEYNAILIDSKNIGRQLYTGKGAGSLPTGAVVYSDLKAIDNSYRYTYNKLKQQEYQFNNKSNTTVLISSEKPIDIKKIGLEHLNLEPFNSSRKQFIAQLSIEELINYKPLFQNEKLSVITIEDEKLINKVIHSAIKKSN